MRGTLSYTAYSLVFEEDFDGPALDRSRFNVELHEPGWVNAELQEYVDSTENIRLEDSLLLIRPVRRVCGEKVSYTSSRITTQHRHDFTYGIFEARLKVPKGKGFLPAFWLMTTDEDTYGQWPVCGEIDIMEVMGHLPQTNYGTIHFGLPHRENQGTVTLPEGDFSESFHIFAVEWLPGLLRWYVDGRLFHETSEWFSSRPGRGSAPFPAPFNHDMYLILNLAVGGS